MAQILDADINSNIYFFLTNFSETLGAGKNSFTVNPTINVVPNQPIFVKAYDPDGNSLPCGEIKPTNANFSEQTNTGKLYYINIFENTKNGIGQLEIKGIGLSLLDYTGSVAYYNNQGYKINDNTSLPLTSAPSSGLLQSVEIIWRRNILIDTTQQTDSIVRFFTSPYIRVKPEIHSAPKYPTGSYSLATGSFSATAVSPRHNSDADYDYQFDEALYQISWKSGTKFSASMEGEQIRVINPTVTNFKYSDYQDPFQGTLNTDFIAKIKKVVNETSLLIDIPFSTVSEILNKTNEDSPYAKNNLVQLKGFTVNDSPQSQTVFHKNNFYALSITDAGFEIFHNNIPIELPRADPSGSSYLISLLNIEHNNLRTLCGALDSYKIYGRSLSSPESKTLLVQGKIEPDQAIQTNKFNSGIYNNPSHFYNQSYLSKHWFVYGSCGFYHSNVVLMHGAVISHVDNSALTDYVIYKDNTDSASQNSTYYSYNLISGSYWYANSPAFINYSVYPTASYASISSIPSLSQYTASQENLLNGVLHDNNSIKLRHSTLYKFSLKVKADSLNSNDAKFYIYYISGTYKKMIGYIDSAYNYGANETYVNTFFSEQETYGTIILVPVKGSWNISSIVLEPYKNVDYSIDSFSVKVPIKTSIPNEHYEIETELYDTCNRLAYGKNSQTFTYNKRFMPLKTNTFFDPLGTSIAIILDGGDSNLSV